MNLNQLNRELKPRGLEATTDNHGFVVITERDMDALADQAEIPDSIFVIKALHQVEVTYRVPATTFEEALEKLCNKEIWAEYGFGDNQTFGVDEMVVEDIGAKAEVEWAYGDPAPTGRQENTRRQWEWDVEENDDE